jgi:hypothetical protein
MVFGVVVGGLVGYGVAIAFLFVARAFEKAFERDGERRAIAAPRKAA